jgi:PAS domain S-box-containing protein
MSTPPDAGPAWPTLRQKLLETADHTLSRGAAAALRRHLDDLECRSALLNVIGEAILILEAPSGRVVQANESACHLIGHRHDELQALTLFHLVDPLAAEPLRAFLAQQPASELRRTFTVDLLTRQGEPVPVEMGLSLATHRDTLYAVALARDARERRRATQFQRGGEDRVAHLMNTIGDAALATDRLGRVTLLNALARDITGWEPAAALGRPLSEVLPLRREDTGEPAPPLDLAPIFDGRTDILPGPVTIQRRDGSRRRLSATAAPIEDSDGRAVGALFVFRDLTDLALREAVVRDEERLMAGGPMVVVKWRDAEGRPVDYLSANAGFLLGRTPADTASGRLGFLDLVHPEDRSRVTEELEAYRQARASSFELKFRILRPDNHVRWTHAYLVAVPGGSPGPAAFQGYLLDITALAVAEIALRDSEQKYRSLVEASTDAILLAARDGRVLECNSAACRLFGYSRTQFPTLQVPDLAAPESRPALDSALAAMGDQGSLFLELPGRRRNGESWPAEFSLRRFRIKGRSHLVVIIRDITARRRAEEEARGLQEQVRHAQKLESLGLLAGGIAHDFNNLLVGVLGNADLALAELPSDSPLRGSLEDIKRAGQRAAELVGQMLAYAGKGRFTIRPLDLCATVQEMMQLMRASLPKKIKIRSRFPARLPLLRADAAQLRQVVMNLLTNAADAIGDASGVITLSAEAVHAGPGFFTDAYLQEERLEGAYVCFQVSDTGCGMDAATRERIFDPFFTTKVAGRGLGLAVLLGIVRAHRGAVKVESEPGKGSTFSIFLPAAEDGAEAGADEESPALSAWRGHGCVLVVDDEPTVCAVARRMLERMGFTVLVATSGREAVGIFQREAAAIVLVLLDMTMPDLDGEDVFRELVQIRSDIPIVLASGYAEQQILGRFRAGGPRPAGFVHKPYAVANLKAALEKALQAAS